MQLHKERALNKGKLHEIDLRDAELHVRTPSKHFAYIDTTAKTEILCLS